MTLQKLDPLSTGPRLGAYLSVRYNYCTYSIYSMACASFISTRTFARTTKPLPHIHTNTPGGRIDHGHHYTQPIRAFDETVEFAKAIEMARSRTSQDNTLIVVTADHSHTMTMSGYSVRGGRGGDAVETPYRPGPKADCLIMPFSHLTPVESQK